MTEFAVVHTDFPESQAAGRALGLQIAEAMQAPPDAVILFASPIYEYATLLQALRESCHAATIVGCSSAGEFALGLQGTGMACALAISSADMRFTPGVGRGLRTRLKSAAQEVAATFHLRTEYPYRSALLFIDGLSCYSGDLLDQLTALTDGTHQFFGVAAGDNGQFRYTPVFYQTEVLADAAVSLEILSRKPIGIGVQHGWRPASELRTINEADGRRLIQIDGRPAVEAFREHARETGQEFNEETPSFFFRRNILGLASATGYKLRAPVKLHEDGAVSCASEVACGSTFRFMTSTIDTVTEAARMAAATAVQQLYGGKPGVTLFFDCASTRLRMGEQFTQELRVIEEVIETSRYLGCNAHAQITRDKGQYGGFVNCTPIVCIFPA